MYIMASTNLIYDKCAYGQRVATSTDPLKYQLYYGKFSNSARPNKEQLKDGQYEQCPSANKCYDKKSLLRVDVESDLKNITRVASQCVTFKYHPNCNNEKSCVRKNDSRVPFYTPPYLNEIRPTNQSKPVSKAF